jgi:hypothetical protein
MEVPHPSKVSGRGSSPLGCTGQLQVLRGVKNLMINHSHVAQRQSVPLLREGSGFRNSPCELWGRAVVAR